jgi:hypothetical protein
VWISRPWPPFRTCELCLKLLFNCFTDGELREADKCKQAVLLSQTIENEDAFTAAFDREENTRSLNLLGVSSPEDFKINPNMLEPQLRLSLFPLLSPGGFTYTL